MYSRISDPEFYPSRIPDPKTATKERGENFFFYHTFLCSHKFHKIENYFSFEVTKKKNLGQFSKNFRTFCPKNCHQALKNIGLGSGIRKKPIPDPGSRGQKGTGSRIRNTDVNGRHLKKIDLAACVPEFIHWRQSVMLAFSPQVWDLYSPVLPL